MKKKLTALLCAAASAACLGAAFLPGGCSQEPIELYISATDPKTGETLENGDIVPMEWQEGGVNLEFCLRRKDNDEIVTDAEGQFQICDLVYYDPTLAEYEYPSYDRDFDGSLPIRGLGEYRYTVNYPQYDNARYAIADNTGFTVTALVGGECEYLTPEAEYPLRIKKGELKWIYAKAEYTGRYAVDVFSKGGTQVRVLTGFHWNEPVEGKNKIYVNVRKGETICALISPPEEELLSKAKIYFDPVELEFGETEIFLPAGEDTVFEYIHSPLDGSYNTDNVVWSLPKEYSEQVHYTLYAYDEHALNPICFIDSAFGSLNALCEYGLRYFLVVTNDTEEDLTANITTREESAVSFGDAFEITLDPQEVRYVSILPFTAPSDVFVTYEIAVLGEYAAYVEYELLNASTYLSPDRPYYLRLENTCNYYDHETQTAYPPITVTVLLSISYSAERV